MQSVAEAHDECVLVCELMNADECRQLDNGISI